MFELELLSPETAPWLENALRTFCADREINYLVVGHGLYREQTNLKITKPRGTPHPIRYESTSPDTGVFVLALGEFRLDLYLPGGGIGFRITTDKITLTYWHPVYQACELVIWR